MLTLEWRGSKSDGVTLKYDAVVVYRCDFSRRASDQQNIFGFGRKLRF